MLAHLLSLPEFGASICNRPILFEIWSGCGRYIRRRTSPRPRWQDLAPWASPQTWHTPLNQYLQFEESSRICPLGSEYPLYPYPPWGDPRFMDHLNRGVPTLSCCHRKRSLVPVTTLPAAKNYLHQLLRARSAGCYFTGRPRKIFAPIIFCCSQCQDRQCQCSSSSMLVKWLTYFFHYRRRSRPNPGRRPSCLIPRASACSAHLISNCFAIWRCCVTYSIYFGW